ncbi:LacI family transcriptional regulator [Sphaerotilus hippei]|uniref:LacI family transcriptional regulator n=1 Tax=Sphaerotilus hippei TaxID=744406 RepID=A0A318GZI3_9BURK|nr:LacI family DNA-binding transcriptional regulator [Sphaerotilus hippei]PXW95168.1 LacI family transcriptional regulator [Sphaerotilus hippei]
MAHTYLMKEVALQAGVSVATVDRVLHERPGVRLATRLRVQQAFKELEKQRQQMGRQGRRFVVDLVMDAPARFSGLVIDALQAAAAQVQPAVFRVREHVADTLNVTDLIDRLDAIARRGSHGVLLKAPNLPETAAAIERLIARGIPVITLVTDIAPSARTAYVGLDNAAAGRTAAYLMTQWLGEEHQKVLVSSSGPFFQGEEERIRAFTQALVQWRPAWQLHVELDGKGLPESTYRVVSQALARSSGMTAVYSVGGANLAVARAFAHAGQACRVFIGHDLDADNLGMLRERQLSAVLHHDLRHDLHSACLQFMQAHGLKVTAPPPTLSRPEVITPFNLPISWTGR